MKSLKIFYISVGVIVFLALMAQFTKPKSFNWEPNFNLEDKNPFGMFVFKDLIKDLFKNNDITFYNKTLYEYIKNSNPANNSGIYSDETKNFIFIARKIPLSNLDVSDIKVLLNKGHNVFISSSNFNELENELGIATYFNDTKIFNNYFNKQTDTVFRFLNESDNPDLKYYYPIGDSYYFMYYDLNYKINIHADCKLNSYYPVVISTNDFGGKLVLCSMPYIFTNINLLDDKYNLFAAKTLSLLPNKPTIIMNYWSDDISPLRFILSDISLRSAYYVLIYSILFFMIFGLKRRQRAIPVINNLTNDTAEYISTITKLFFASKDNKQIALKKTNHFYYFIKNTLNTNINIGDEEFYKYLSGKSGMPLKNIKEIFENIEKLYSSNNLDDETLEKYCNRIDEFYKKVK